MNLWRCLLLLIGSVSLVSISHDRPVNGSGKHLTPGTQDTPESVINEKQGIARRASNHSVDQTLDRLKKILQSKGVTLFAVIDHSGEAEKVGMKMPPIKLLIFGSPKAGTPLMLAAPSIAIDLPLKILVSEDNQGKVWLSYNTAEYLKDRHGLPENLMQNIAVVSSLADQAGQ